MTNVLQIGRLCLGTFRLAKSPATICFQFEVAICHFFVTALIVANIKTRVAR